MATPSSGTISLNQIHVEAGGSSGTTCSINDADIRLIANKSSGATASWNDYYNRAKDYAISQTTGGTNVTTTGQYSSTIQRYRGYTNNSGKGMPNTGSYSPSSDSDYFSNNTFSEQHVEGQQGAITISVNITVKAQNVANDDNAFKSVVIGSSTYNRSDATYGTGYYSGTINQGFSRWTWTGTGSVPTNDTDAFSPFSAAGSTTSITFRRSR